MDEYPVTFAYDGELRFGTSLSVVPSGELEGVEKDLMAMLQDGTYPDVDPDLAGLISQVQTELASRKGA